MGTLLFVDMLGVKARWLQLGKDGAESAFKRFRGLIETATKQQTDAPASKGGMDADAAGFVFPKTEDAVRFARGLYYNAFFAAKSESDERIWLRGVIMPAGADEDLRKRTILPGNIELHEYSASMLEAIQVEKSGFKGMRMVVEKTLLTRALRELFKASIQGKAFYPFKKLAYAPLPERIADSYEDFLWMASGDDKQWQGTNMAMANRLRWCAPKMGEEFLHAAATQVVFNECSALLSSPKTQEG